VVVVSIEVVVGIGVAVVVDAAPAAAVEVGAVTGSEQAESSRLALINTATTTAKR
jgi:hypothetical protein